MNKQNKHTEEHKADNKKTVTVNGQKKLLLFDNEGQEGEPQIFEKELQKTIKQFVAEILEEIKNDKKQLCEAWLDEADYPEGFSLETFRTLSSYKKRAEYAKKYLGRLGKGSGRIVFAADRNTVVKIAVNKKGLAQNDVEADVSRIGYENIAKVIDHDDEYLYIEAERAQKIKKSDWKRLTGWTFDEWSNTLNNYINENRGQSTGWKLPVPPDFEEIEETELFNNIVTMMADFDMPVGDVAKINSWGMVTREGKEVLVLVDYGLTQSVWEEYYGHRRGY